MLNVNTILNLLTNVRETHENFLRSCPHSVTLPKKTPSLLVTIHITELAEDLGKYFCRKIELFKDIENTAVVPPTAEYRLPDIKLETLRPLSEEEVYNIIIKSSNATCSLPTWLLKLCTRELTPVIMKMVNLSLSEGHVPDSWKVAILTAILKKYGLDLVFGNFRPVSNLSFVAKATEKAVVNQLFEHCGDKAPLPTNLSSISFH